MPDNCQTEYNISKLFFKECHQIQDRRKKPLTNVYFLKANRENPVYGTVYLMHGYGGSPIEPCMKIPMMNALECGFDIVAIESIALSATSDMKKNLSDMNFARHKYALTKGLEYCGNNTGLASDYKVAWAHSMSCRALSDLSVHSEIIRGYFDELVMNNPYFLPPSKLQRSKQKCLEKDPSGRTWKILSHRPIIQTFHIEGKPYSIPANINNLEVPLPSDWKSDDYDLDLKNIADKASQFFRNLKIDFILGAEDDKAEYMMNKKLIDALNLKEKRVFTIDKAGHYFENGLEEYDAYSRLILNEIIKLPRRSA
ncbi:MAG: hypothetical protein LBD50_02515 [Rickettsiales bacterium]|jgi:hypothetical protein|nr:hypothetical protein [Rickettsiales bacterium]